MGVFKSLAGMVTVELTSADIPGSLLSVNERGIQMFGVQMDGELTARFDISRRDYRKLSADASRRGERLRLVGRKGLYWALKGMLRRPVLLAGVVLMMILVLAVPNRVLFVQVEGNKSVPTRMILAAAEESGICFGASRREVRSEKVKNALLAAVPELQWAGVNTYGCTAVISVRERAQAEEPEEDYDVSSIVAARDGIVLSCTVTRGNGLCVPGQAVQAGEVLISGYTDCGLCITATRAEGEIIAQTRRDLTVITPAERQIRTVVEEQNEKYSLIIGKKRINFYKGSGISDTSCVKMYSEYCLTLPGGFRLPVTLVKETCIRYFTAASELSQEAAAEELSAFAAAYLKRQMIAGSIIDSDQEIALDNGAWRLTGEYACTEMIGRQQREQIGVIP